MATYNPALPTRPCEFQGMSYYINLVGDKYHYFIRRSEELPFGNPPVKSEEGFDSVVAANNAAREQIALVTITLPNATLNAAPTGSRIVCKMNYFTDLAMAIERGLFAKGKRPKEQNLYATIACYNADYPEED